MATDEKSASEIYKPGENSPYKGLVRKNGQGWPAAKYGRMGIYVYLYNRIKGRPRDWGLDNEDVSFRIKDIIEKRLDEVLDKYKVGEIAGVNLKDPAQRAVFLKEIGDYNEHAQKVGSPMPSFHEMNRFLQTVSEEKNSYYMTIHKSVQQKSGDYFSDKDKQVSLIWERHAKLNEIRERKRDIRRDNFWTGLKGGGALASGAVTVGSGVALFIPPVGTILGIAGIAGGLAGLRQFGGAFLAGIAGNIKKRQKLRDLKRKEGEKGNRGLKAIEKKIKYHKDLKKIMDNVGKINKDGRVPTEKEFVAYIRHNFPSTYREIMKGIEGNMHKLYEDSVNHYEVMFGSMRQVMDHLGRYAVDINKNDELAIERDDLYKNAFNVGDDGKSPKLDEKGKPVLGGDGSPVFENQDLAAWKRTYNQFKLDAKVYQEHKMSREYDKLDIKAAQSLYNIYMNDMFEKAYSTSSPLTFAKFLKDPDIEKKLKENPDGDKTQLVSNAVKFIDIESRLDRYNNGSIDHALTGGLGVSIKQQLVKNSEFNTVVGQACKNLMTNSDGTLDPNYTKVNEIVSAIYSVVNSEPCTKEMFKTIEYDLNVLPNSRAKSYLQRLVGIKKDEARITSNDIKDALTEKYSNIGMDVSLIMSHPSVTKIMNDITRYPSGASNEYNGIVKSIDGLHVYREKSTNEIKIFTDDEFKKIPPDLKENFIKENTFIDTLKQKLAEQVTSSEAKKRNELRANVLEDIENGRLNNSEDLTKYFEEFIDKINFEQITTKLDEIKSFYNTKIAKSSTNNLREYLEMRLSNKIELELTNKLQNNFTVYPAESEDSMKRLKTDVMAINNNPYLSDEQKKRIMSLYTKHVDILIKSTTKTMQRQLLNESSTEKYSQEIAGMVERKVEEGGLAQFLGLKDGEAEFDTDNLLDTQRKQLAAFRRILDKKDTFETSYGQATSSDGKSLETTLLLKLLLTTDGNTPNDENIAKMLDKIDNMKLAISQKGSGEMDELKGCYDKRDDPDNPSRKIYTAKNLEEIKKLPDESLIKTVVEQIDLAEDVTEFGADPRKQLAYMIMLKRQIITVIKAEIIKILSERGSDSPSIYLSSGNGAKKLDKLRAVWTAIGNEFDKKLTEIQNTLRGTGFDFGGNNVKSLSNTISQFLNPTNADALSKGKASTLDSASVEMS